MTAFATATLAAMAMVWFFTRNPRLRSARSPRIVICGCYDNQSRMLDAQTIAALQFFPPMAEIREIFDVNPPAVRTNALAEVRARNIVNHLKSAITKGICLNQETRDLGIKHARALMNIMAEFSKEDRQQAVVVLDKAICDLENRQQVIVEQHQKMRKRDIEFVRKIETMFSPRYSKEILLLLKERQKIASEMCDALLENTCLFKAYSASMDERAVGGKRFENVEDLDAFLAQL